MRAFLLVDEDYDSRAKPPLGGPVAEGIEFSDGTRVVRWLDDGVVHVYPPGVGAESIDAAEPHEMSEKQAAWYLLWVTAEMNAGGTTPFAEREDIGDGPVDLPPAAEVLAEVRREDGWV